VELPSQKSLPEFIRYVFVGGFNTVFGYGVFALINWLFRGLGSYSYLYASFLSSVITISLAFLAYKWLVFRTRGNYLIEWIRCFGVYGTSVLISLAGMAVLVPILRRVLHRPEQASYIAAAIMTVFIALFGFVGHRNFSFRQSTPIANKEDQREGTSI
jgi:putative flippase GtrA